MLEEEDPPLPLPRKREGEEEGRLPRKREGEEGKRVRSKNQPEGL
jgi:hypothetical protein